MLNPRRFLSLTTLVLALSLVACGDDETASNNENNSTIPAVNNVDVPAGSQLLHTGSCAGNLDCAMDVTFTSDAELKVQLIDGNNNPITGARVEFELEAGEAAGTTLDARASGSDDSGFASVRLRAGTTQGVATVTASVPGDNSVQPVRFLVSVASKDSASYRVQFTHTGPSKLADINVRLFPSTVSCEDFYADLAADRDDDPNTLPMLTADHTATGIANIDGTLPLVVVPGLANGSSYTVGALAMSRANSEVESAVGCTAMNPAIADGASVDVTVELIDHLPRVGGEYSVVHTFSVTEAVCEDDGNGNFTGVLPENVCLAIDYIGRLATDPASFLLGQGMGDTGLLGLIVDYLPDDGPLGELKGTINDFLSNDIFSGIGRDALNSFFEDWLQNSAPGWVTAAGNITADIYDSISQFRVNGLIRISSEPVVDIDNGRVIGTLVADMDGNKPGKQVWESIVVYYSGGCEGQDDSCREREFSAGDLGASDVIEGYFTGSVVPLDDMENPGYGLVIDPHSLTVNYGTLLLAIIENVVLPRIFGANVNTLEAAIEALLDAVVDQGDDGCEGLALAVADDGSTIYNVVNNLCGQLIVRAGDGVREFLAENLAADTEGAFVMGTTDGMACRISEPNPYLDSWVGKPLPYAQTLGTPEMQCEWTVNIKAGSATIETQAPFHADRTGF